MDRVEKLELMKRENHIGVAAARREERADIREAYCEELRKRANWKTGEEMRHGFRK